MSKEMRVAGIALVLCLVASIFPGPVALTESLAGEAAAGSHDTMGPEAVRGAKDDSLRLDTAYLKGYLTDTLRIAESPRFWDARDWSAAALVLTMSAGLYAYDQELRDWFQKQRNGTTDDLAKVFTPVGNPFIALPAMGFLYYYGETQESEKARRIGLLGAESIVLSGAFTGVLKVATHRHRPDTGDRYDSWDGPGFSTDNLSFPSEHASTAFALATVIASESSAPYAGPVAYGVATLTALSRLNDNDHWASDVFFGAALGYFTGRAVVGYHKKNGSLLSLQPDVGPEHRGVRLSYLF